MHNDSFIPFNIETLVLSGKNLIEASAGTGKTFSICRIFLKALLENHNKFNYQSILVITYTNAATYELKRRIRKTLKEALEYFESGKDKNNNLKFLEKYNPNLSKKIIKDSIINFDETNIFTIHGFCKKVIDENNLTFSENIVPDDSQFIEEYVKDFWRKNILTLNETFLNYMIFSKKITVENLIHNCQNISKKVKFKVFPKTKNTNLKIELTDIENSLKIIKKIKTKVNSNYNGYFQDLEKVLFHPFLNKRSFSQKICSELIKEFGFYFQNDIYLIPTTLEKLKTEKIIENIKKGENIEIPEIFEFIDILFEQTDKIKIKYDEFIIEIKSVLYEKLHKELLARKEHYSLLSYNDLLFKLYNSLSNGSNGRALAEKIRKKYKLAMIDEFQDTDPIQYEIFKKIFYSKDTTVFFIGDPKQSIYSFRGGDIFTYMKAAKEVTKKYTLNKCFRSKKEIVDAINKIFSKSKAPFIFKDITYNKTVYKQCKENIDIKEAFNIYAIKGSKLTKDTLMRKTGTEIAQKIFYLLNEKKVKPEKIAIIVRTHNEAAFYNDFLKQFNVKTVIHSDISVFETKEAFETEKLLLAIKNPTDKKKVFTALSTDFFGKNSDEILELQTDTEKFEKIVSEFAEYKEKWINFGFMNMFYALTSENLVFERIMSQNNGERAVTNLLHISELLNKASINENLSMEGVIKWLNERRIGSVKTSEYELRLESDENAVSIVTIHKSKGLEYPFLFFPFFFGEIRSSGKDEIFYHNDKFELILNLGKQNENDNFEKFEKDEKFSEMIRLFYVAITRAIVQCNIFIYIDDAKGLINPVLNHLTDNNSDFLKKYIKDASQEQEHEKSALPVSEKNNNLHFKSFSGTIGRKYVVDSFTKISFRKENEKSDETDFDFTISPDTVEKNIFTLPKGAETGLLFHRIMETIDFSNEDKQLELRIKEEIKTSNPAYEEWCPVILNTVKKVLNIELITEEKEKIILKKTDKSKKIPEMEFYLSVENEKKFLKEIFKDIPETFKKNMPNNGFTLKTYLRGFIDLIFQWQGKFFIIDWKSNFLGDSPDDYNIDNLEKVISSHLYFLQYYIYSAALYAFLKTRKDYFDYNEFGGVFYIFIRGVEHGKGIFFDKPSKKFFSALEELI